MTVPAEERDPAKTCNTDGCDAWATEQSDRTRCRNCGGESTGAPEGNDNAKGNDGGAAPEGNKNAMTHGIHADPMGLFDWLRDNEPEAAAYILGKLHDYAERAPEPVFVVDVTPDDVETFDDVTAQLTAYGDDLLTTCVRDYARKRAEYLQLTEGILTEQTRATEAGPVQIEDSNPVNIDLDRFDRNQLRRKDKLGVLPDDGADVEVEVTAKMWENLTEYYDE